MLLLSRVLRYGARILTIDSLGWHSHERDESQLAYSSTTALPLLRGLDSDLSSVGDHKLRPKRLALLPGCSSHHKHWSRHFSPTKKRPKPSDCGCHVALVLADLRIDLQAFL